MNMANRKPTAPKGELLAIVRNAPRPTLTQRGQLLFAADIMELLQHRVSRWWINNSFLQEKKVKIGRLNAWWEVDVLAAIDDGVLTDHSVRRRGR